MDRPPYEFAALLRDAEDDLLWAQIAAPIELRAELDAMRDRLIQLIQYEAETYQPRRIDRGAA